MKVKTTTQNVRELRCDLPWTISLLVVIVDPDQGTGVGSELERIFRIAPVTILIS